MAGMDYTTTIIDDATLAAHLQLQLQIPEDPVKEEMSVREMEMLTSVAKSMTESLLEATDLLGGIPWCLVHEKHGISLFRADVGNNVPCNVHAVCKVTCEIEDVAESMITSTTESYTKMMELLSSDFIEGAVIQNIVEPTEFNPHRYVALKWAAFKSSSKFTKDRDFIILEYVDMIEDDQGQKIAFRIMESVDVPKSSKYAESPKYTRDIVPLMGFMYHTTKKQGELRMTYTCNFDNGDLPAWAANSAIQSHVEKCINGILKYIETFRASKETIVLPQQVMSMCEQDHCKVCERNFCVLRRRYNCLKCGEVICSSCSTIRSALVPDHGERLLRVCTACVLEVRRTSRFATDSPHSAPSLTSASAPSSSSGQSQARFPISPGQPGSIVRTQSFSTGKRRSYDDLLEPVRNRLIEHKTFSSSPEIVEIPKASFPLRSLSDGFVMRKGNFFTSKRRGSPADLAISIEAFRQHQMRMGGSSSDQEPEDGDFTDTEESMRQFEYFSSSTTTSTSPSGGQQQSDSSDTSSPTAAQSPVHTPRRPQRRQHHSHHHERVHPETSLLSPLNATQPLIEEGIRSKKHNAFESKINGNSNQNGGYSFPTMKPETKAKLDAAIQLSQNIIDDAAYANNLAQHARKLSHHRIVALQMEHEVMAPVGNHNNNSSNNQYEPQRNNTRHHRAAIMQTASFGSPLYDSDMGDQQIVVLSRAMEQVGYSHDAGARHQQHQQQMNQQGGGGQRRERSTRHRPQSSSSNMGDGSTPSYR
ncbi:Hepatocyte growth factor-regulated tyrosine kinase substrate [Globisporangium polare]